MASRKRGQKARKSTSTPKTDISPKVGVQGHASNWSKSKKWVAGIIGAALTAALATALVNVFHDVGHAASQLLPKTPGSNSPVLVAVRREAGFSGGCGRWIVTTPIQRMAAPSQEFASPEWLERSRAIDATSYGLTPSGNAAAPNGTSNIDVTVQGRTATPVILTGIQFIPVRRSSSKIHGAVITVACGGPMEAAGIEVNLDDNPIKIVSRFRYMVPKLPAGQPQWLLTALRFPYKVTDTDGEVFKIIAYSRRYTAWYAILYWSVNGRNGQSVIKDNGKPFQTAPATMATTGYGYKNGHWFVCKQLDSITCSVQ